MKFLILVLEIKEKHEALAPLTLEGHHTDLTRIPSVFLAWITIRGWTLGQLMVEDCI